MTAETNLTLASETAEALLNAIKDQSANTNREGLRNLAESYSLVCGAMPKKKGGVTMV